MTSVGSSETAEVLVLALNTSTSQGGVALVEESLDGILSVRSRAVWQRVKSHSEFLTPTIQTALDEAGLTLKDVDALAVGRGPGSFTGIRIGVSAIKGLAYALRKPIYAFDTLEILANGVSDHSLPVLSLVNAHKNLLFTGIYDWSASAEIAGPSIVVTNGATDASKSSSQALSHGVLNFASKSSVTSLGQWKPRFEIQALSLDEIARLVQEPILCVGDGYLEYQDHFPLELRQSLMRNALFADEPSPEVLGKMALAWRGHNQPLEWNLLQALYIRASGAEESLETKHR